MLFSACGKGRQGRFWSRIAPCNFVSQRVHPDISGCTGCEQCFTGNLGGARPQEKGDTMIYIHLFWEFMKIGLFAVGGGMATLPFLQRLSESASWYPQSLIIDMVPYT